MIYNYTDPDMDFLDKIFYGIFSLIDSIENRIYWMRLDFASKVKVPFLQFLYEVGLKDKPPIGDIDDNFDLNDIENE